MHDKCSTVLLLSLPPSQNMSMLTAELEKFTKKEKTATEEATVNPSSAAGNSPT